MMPKSASINLHDTAISRIVNRSWIMTAGARTDGGNEFGGAAALVFKCNPPSLAKKIGMFLVSVH